MLFISAVLLCVVVLSIIVEPRSAVLFNPNAENRVAIGAAIVLTAALSDACVQIQISRLVRNEHLAVIIFYFAATSTAAAALMSLFGWVALSHLNALLLRPLYILRSFLRLSSAMQYLGKRQAFRC